jgi:beta-glucanase (GH16 family)
VASGQPQNPSTSPGTGPAISLPPVLGTPGVLPAPGTPSGAAIPTGNLPGWQQVFADDFAGTSLNASNWGTYQGQPGGDPGGWWDPSHVVVHNGLLELQTYQDPAFGNRWVSGGLSSARALKQTYGKYLVRFRMDKGNGIGGIGLLWPSDGGWPPEIDFVEDGGGNRTDTSATLHYGSSDNQVQRSVSADFSQWHTIGVEWTPGTLTYTLDGAVWATVVNVNVPAVPMEMDLQTQAGTCGDQWAPCPDATTPAHVNLQVDWVVAYKMA